MKLSRAVIHRRTRIRPPRPDSALRRAERAVREAWRSACDLLGTAGYALALAASEKAERALLAARERAGLLRVEPEPTWKAMPEEERPEEPPWPADPILCWEDKLAEMDTWP